ncbi:MAG: hypothetical protein KDD06_17945 [Phaeodactylibacter sp.]|nr:hypothetical protein [Phaeodactylibacter sp.]MCB9289528.1 hypothetical protein [Lewinellaceae bacterium]
MKNYILLLAAVIGVGIFFSACCEDHHDDEPDTCAEEGIIIGIDFRECACCGGWFIEIGNDTLRAPDLPQAFRESLDPNEFPLPVYLDWAPVETPCLGDEIEVACIQRQE